MQTDPYSEWDSLLAHDPGARGIAGNARLRTIPGGSPLREAAESFQHRRGAAILVTGFYIFNAPRPAAETDGPPGALFLARTLHDLGRRVAILSDRHGLPLLEVGCRFLNLDVELIEFPFEQGGANELPRASHAPEHNERTNAWIDQWLASDLARDAAHLIAIERVGPSHTLASLASQQPCDPADIELFARDTPPAHRDACHNMRGDIITGHTAKTHLLFEKVAARRSDVATVGMADGGNELGMGAWPWRDVRDAIATGPGGRLACRIPVRFPLLAGVSNWAAYALAAAIARNEGRSDLVAPEWIEREQRLIESLVEQAGAVDGVARESRPTVDGLSPAIYGEMMERILSAGRRADASSE